MKFVAIQKKGGGREGGGREGGGREGGEKREINEFRMVYTGIT